MRNMVINMNFLNKVYSNIEKTVVLNYQMIIYTLEIAVLVAIVLYVE